MKRKLLLGLILISIILVSGCIQDQEAEPTCGDAICNANETCFTCPEDCGTCQSICGDNTCDTDETCSICPIDCGACPAVCGNNVCELTEDCNSCIQDCACLENQYCSENGICRDYICGDDTCSDNEIDICCEDCGCPEDKVCNKNTQECQEKPTIPETNITDIANNYLEENGITGTITRISDEYYEDQIVKQVSIDCAEEGDEFPCQIILFIDNDGTIIEEMRTG